MPFFLAGGAIIRATQKIGSVAQDICSMKCQEKKIKENWECGTATKPSFVDRQVHMIQV